MKKILTSAPDVIWEPTIEERAMREQRDHTIERCAQVAEEPKDIYGIGAEIAAAIRDLKNK